METSCKCKQLLIMWNFNVTATLFSSMLADSCSVHGWLQPLLNSHACCIAHVQKGCVLLVYACRPWSSYVPPNQSNSTFITTTQPPQWQHHSQCSPCTNSHPTLHTLPSLRPHHQAHSIPHSSSPHSKGSTILPFHSLHQDTPPAHPQGTLPRSRDLLFSISSSSPLGLPQQPGTVVRLPKDRSGC